MDGLTLSALEFVDRYNSLALDELIADYSKLVQSFGFQHFIMAGLPTYGEDPESLIIVNRWPQEWLDRYRERAHFYFDPVTQWSFSQTRPFLWQDAREGCDATARAVEIEGEAREHGLVDGVGFPVADPDHWQAVVSLASDRHCELSDRQQALIYLSSVLCQGRALELKRTMALPRAELSPREKEVLTWIAHGKSSWDTSVILNVSERTVEKHLASARTKLHVSNTTHAVARALHSRQIRL